MIRDLTLGYQLPDRSHVWKQPAAPLQPPWTGMEDWWPPEVVDNALELVGDIADRLCDGQGHPWPSPRTSCGRYERPMAFQSKV